MREARHLVLIPSYDTGERLFPTVREARACWTPVWVVIDGSTDGTGERLERLALDDPGLRVLRLPENRGKGAAVLHGARAALAEGFTHALTMDADGQHRASDLGALVAAVDAGADVAFGNRFLGGSEVPPARALLLRAAGVFERAVTGLPLTDAHNGFRAFGRRALSRVAIRQNRMAHATEIRAQIARAVRRERLRIVEVPVSIRYTAETLAKGQRATGAFDVLRDLFQHYLFEESE